MLSAFPEWRKITIKHNFSLCALLMLDLKYIFFVLKQIFPYYFYFLLNSPAAVNRIALDS